MCVIWLRWNRPLTKKMSNCHVLKDVYVLKRHQKGHVKLFSYEFFWGNKVSEEDDSQWHNYLSRRLSVRGFTRSSQSVGRLFQRIFFG